MQLFDLTPQKDDLAHYLGGGWVRPSPPCMVSDQACISVAHVHTELKGKGVVIPRVKRGNRTGNVLWYEELCIARRRRSHPAQLSGICHEGHSSACSVASLWSQNHRGKIIDGVHLQYNCEPSSVIGNQLTTGMRTS